jgi:hypothetical protein
MNVVLRIAGILLAALGLLLVLLVVYSPEVAPGVNLNSGISLLLGGIIVLGLSGVVSAVEDLKGYLAGEDKTVAGAGARGHRPLDQTSSSATAAAIAPEPSIASAEVPGSHSQPPPRAAEQRRPPFDTGKSVEARLQNLDEESRSVIDRVVEEVREHGNSPSAETEVVSEENLYVVEEREIAGKQARVLSDGTVEAETDEGWMRFENPEHLEEYMAAMSVNVGRG